MTSKQKLELAMPARAGSLALPDGPGGFQPPDEWPDVVLATVASMGFTLGRGFEGQLRTSRPRLARSGWGPAAGTGAWAAAAPSPPPRRRAAATSATSTCRSAVG